MLSTFVQMDFEDVLDELNLAGYAFELAWFARTLPSASRAWAN